MALCPTWITFPWSKVEILILLIWTALSYGEVHKVNQDGSGGVATYMVQGL